MQNAATNKPRLSAELRELRKRVSQLEQEKAEIDLLLQAQRESGENLSDAIEGIFQSTPDGRYITIETCGSLFA